VQKIATIHSQPSTAAPTATTAATGDVATATAPPPAKLVLLLILLLLAAPAYPAYLPAALKHCSRRDGRPATTTTTTSPGQSSTTTTFPGQSSTTTLPEVCSKEGDGKFDEGWQAGHLRVPTRLDSDGLEVLQSHDFSNAKLWSLN